MRAVTALPWMITAHDPDEEGTYHFFSASQIETFLDCRRKWAWDKIARIPRPSAASAKVGDRCHKQLETFLDGGKLDFAERVNGVKVGDVCASGVHLLPTPCTPATGPETPEQQRARHARHGMTIEGDFLWRAPGTAFVFLGRKDLEVEDSRSIPGLDLPCPECNDAKGARETCAPCGFTGRVPITDATAAPGILDHKSTSSIASWAKTPEQLEWDVQANLYAYDLIAKYDAPAADLVWTYYQTKGAKDSKRVHLRVTREHAVKAFNAIKSVAADMATIRNRAPKFDNSPRDVEGPPDMGREWRAAMAAFVEEITPNGHACEKYGGCAYRHMCRLTPAEGAFSFMSQSKPDPLFDSLRKRAAAADGVPITTKQAELPPTCAATDVPAPADAPAWATAPVDPMSLRKRPSAAPPAPAKTLEERALSEETGAVSASEIAAAVAAAKVEVNPPESKLPPPALPPPPAAEPEESESAEDGAEVIAPKKRAGGGRPKGSKNKSKKDPEGADAAMHTGAPVKEEGDAAAKKALVGVVDNVIAKGEACTTPGDAFEPCEEPAAELAFELYVDCIPLQVGYSVLEDFIADAQEIVRKETEACGEGVADYRFIDYGKGAGALAIATLAALRANPPAALVVRTNTSEAYAVLATITPFASRVVQGLR